MQDNSEELRKKLLKNQQKLIRLLNHAPNMIAAEESHQTRQKSLATENNGKRTLYSNANFNTDKLILFFVF